MVLAYIECALWSSTDESDEKGGEPLDRNYTIEDIEPHSLQTMIINCLTFAHGLGKMAEKAIEAEGVSQFGHDLWLTQNGHGAGFWDGDWDDIEGVDPKLLTLMAKRLGECNLLTGGIGGKLEVYNG